MTNSVIIGFVISIWNALVRWYDNSLLAAIINAICDFFVKRASGSLVVRGFMHGFLTGNWWKNSTTYRLMSLPFKNREEKKIEKGAILDAVLEIFNIPLRDIGALLLTAAIACGAGLLVLHGIGKDLIIPGLVFALAIVCLVLNKSAFELYVGSGFLRFIGGFFAEIPQTAAPEKPIKLLPGCIFAAIVGLAAGLTNPIAVFGAVFAMLFAAAVAARFEIGVYTIIFSAAFLPTSAMAGLCVLTAIGFAAALFGGRIKNAAPDSFAPLLALFVLFGIFATLTSFHIKSSTFIFCVYVVFIGAYIMIVNTLTTPARWKAATVAFAAGTLFIALLGIMQNFTMDVTTQSWVDSNMFEDIKTRVYATFDNPNVLGQYFIVTIPIVFALFCAENKPSRKTVWLAVTAVCLLCLMYTWSRGAWVGVLLGIVIFLLLKDRRWTLICILGLVAMPFVLPASILNRIMSIGNTGDSSTAYRVSVWIASARMAKDFWMSGVGFGAQSFAAVYSGYALNGAGFALHPHNFYIQLVLNMGIGGLITYLLMVATAYREIATVKGNDKTIKNVTLAAAGILAGYMFQGIAESLWYNLRMSLIFWILTALVTSGAKTDRTVAQ